MKIKTNQSLKGPNKYEGTEKNHGIAIGNKKVIGTPLILFLLQLLINIIMHFISFKEKFTRALHKTKHYINGRL